MAYVWAKSEARDATLLVALALADWADEDGYCYPSVRQLATKARVTPRSVYRALQQLIDLGELERVGKQPELRNLSRRKFLHNQPTTCYHYILGCRETDMTPETACGKAVENLSKSCGKAPLTESLGSDTMSLEGVTLSHHSLYVIENRQLQEQKHGAHAGEEPDSEATPALIFRLLSDLLDTTTYSSLADVAADLKADMARLHLTATPATLTAVLEAASRRLVP